MRPILLIMWTAFKSFILRNNNNNNYNNNNISGKVSVHQIKNSPGTAGPRIGPGSRRV